MTESAFRACLQFVLDQEGGFTATLDDGEAATNQGVTLSTLSAFCGWGCSIADLHAMSARLRDAIYYADYWTIAGNGLPPGPDLMTFDFGVNAGAETSALILQSVLGVVEDGDIGPHTLAAAALFHPADLVNALAARQEAHYRALPSFSRFGSALIARTARRKKAGLFRAIRVSVSGVSA